jgi:hypothetical protein
MTWNTTFQLHPVPKLWPELEVNYTHFKYGDNDGKNQTGLTAGVIAGGFELTRRALFLAVVIKRPLADSEHLIILGC